jgi:methylglutaconyl-CoA hydratase
MAIVELERGRAVAFLWLNRPEQHNALSGELGAAIESSLHDLAHDESIRVVVIGGRGPSFCAGADIHVMKASANATFEQNLEEAERFGAIFAAISGFPKPIVARVHGSVMGGGVGLVCAADIAVASDDARFGLTEVRLGIIPGLISPYVLRRLGDRAAREKMLTGERFEAAEAHRIGLVHHVVPLADLDARVDERVQALLAGAPRAQRRIKSLLAQWADSGWEEYRTGLPRALAEVRSGDEARDGLSAFFEKRKPKWLQTP